MFNNILFVCVGNICRSPAGEALLKHLRPELEVSSAGLGALVGHDADHHVKDILAEQNIPCEHSARQINDEIIRDADLVLVMEKNHLNAIIQSNPQSRGKVFLLGKWDEDTEVADPFQQPRAAFDAMYAQIDKYVRLWIDNAL